MPDYPTQVHDLASAVELIRWCVNEIGMGYHPDTPFADYANPDGSRCFTDEQARELDALTEASFQYCDPYSVGMSEFERGAR